MVTVTGSLELHSSPGPVPRVSAPADVAIGAEPLADRRREGPLAPTFRRPPGAGSRGDQAGIPVGAAGRG